MNGNYDIGILAEVWFVLQLGLGLTCFLASLPKVGSLSWHVLVLHSVLEPEGVDELLVQVRRQGSILLARGTALACTWHVLGMYLSCTLWAHLARSKRSLVYSHAAQRRMNTPAAALSRLWFPH
jgi:hypothetical protein